MKPPGGELTFYSAIWIAFSVLALYLAAFHGMTGFYVIGPLVGLPALGMWFEQRWCGYLFSALMMISIPLALFALITVDNNGTEWAKRLLKIASACYFAYITFRWAADD